MGGKRKSAKRVAPKKKQTVSKIFKCPYCAHEDACEVKMDRNTETGTIKCRICGEDFQCRISYLSDPVDVYCEWIDACESARDGAAGGAGGGGGGAAGV
jgi:transcription elongation factor Elf1